MKKLLSIVRHAKAEDSSSFFGDFERELTPSGIIDAARIGKSKAHKSLKPDLIISSAAPRAYQTARVMAEQFGIDYETIVSVRELYDGGPKAYLHEVNNAPDTCRHLMIVGHNPDVSFFAEYLTKAEIGSMSKGSIVLIEFDITNWQEITAHTGKFISYDTPKQLREGI